MFVKLSARRVTHFQIFLPDQFRTHIYNSKMWWWTNITWKKPQSLHAWWSFANSSSCSSDCSLHSFLISIIGISKDSSIEMLVLSRWGRMYLFGISCLKVWEASSCTFATGRDPPTSLVLLFSSIDHIFNCNTLNSLYASIFPFLVPLVPWY